MKFISKLLFTMVATLVWFFSNQAHAEYRAFLLQMKSPTAEQAIFVKSSLDPEQYRCYYNVPKDVQISYTETWMCPPRGLDQSLYKRTIAYDPICKSPKEIATEKEAETKDNPNPATSPSTQSPERQPAAK